MRKWPEKHNQQVIKRWWDDSAHIVQTEVDLALLSNRIYLRFTPTYVSREFDKFIGKVRGVYEAVVLKKDGKETKPVPVDTWWVEQNFTAECLSVVQRIGTETAIHYRHPGTTRTEYGYVPLEDRDALEDYETDALQISKIRYLPEKKKIDGQGREYTLKPKWRGLIQTNIYSKIEYRDLEDEWVKKNIRPGFIELLKDVAVNNRYLLIPEGACNSHLPSSGIFPDNAPIAHYSCVNVAGRCVYSALASGLHHLGLHREAFFVDAGYNDIESETSPMDHARSILFGDEASSNIFESTGTGKSYQLHSFGRKKKRKWNTLRDSPFYSLCLLGVRSNDGKTDHAICIVGEWIFDSNMPKALPLSKESLNICCSDGIYNITDYTSVTRGFMIREITRSKSKDTATPKEQTTKKKTTVANDTQARTAYDNHQQKEHSVGSS